MCGPGDSLRPFILHAFGGLYLDYDIQCFKATDTLLDGYQLVLQSAELGGYDVTNAVMASVPHHPFWLTTVTLLEDRAHLASTDVNSGTPILLSTGPRLLRDALDSLLGWKVDQHGSWVGEWRTEYSLLRVYGIGEWFVPCVWNDYSCHEHFNNVSQLLPDSMPENLVGHHHCSGTWLKRIKIRNQKRTINAVAAAVFLLVSSTTTAVLAMRFKFNMSLSISAVLIWIKTHLQMGIHVPFRANKRSTP